MENKIDISYRYGLARTGTWTLSEIILDIPMIAGISGYLPDGNDQTVPIESAVIDEMDSLNNRLGEIFEDLLKIESYISRARRYSNNEKTEQLKLKFISELNPMLTIETITNKKKKESNNSELSLIMPGTFQYPDCFVELGITPKAVFPGLTTQRAQNQQNFFQVDIIMDSNPKLKHGSGILVIHNTVKLFNNPSILVNRILTLDHRLNLDKLLYLPGVATVNNLAILVYLGVDIFDICQCILQARLGNLMTGSGLIHNKLVASGLCNCDGCKSLSSIKDTEKERDKRFNSILMHNVSALFSELGLIKTVLAQGTLRNLVEQRMVTDPKLTELVRNMDLKHYNILEKYFPVYKNQSFITTSREALNRVEVNRFRERVINRYKKPDDAQVLLLLPCSAKKPYSTSKSHKMFRYAIQNSIKGQKSMSIQRFLHEVIVTSPLGLVPRELELVYPAQQYDIPVTGHWFEDELKMIKMVVYQYLLKNQYKHIIIHLSSQLAESIVESISNLSQKGRKPKVIQTCDGSSTNHGSIEELTKQLKNVQEIYTSDHEEISKLYKGHNYSNLMVLTGISQYQFGDAAVELMRGCSIKGRYPYLKIYRDGDQLGMLTGERGMISLTISGGESLLNSKKFDSCIEIDDFIPKGSIMAVGVSEASTNIRAGDEVVACYKDEIRAVGTATMSGPEMEKSQRGAAVKVRHHVKE